MEITKTPHNILAEQRVIGCIIKSPKLLAVLDPKLYEQDFYSPELRLIYATILVLIGQSKPITIVSVSQRLDETRSLKRIGGLEYLQKITDNLSDTDYETVNYNASLIKELSKKRDIIRRGYKAIIEAQTGTKSANEILDVLLKEVFLPNGKTLKIETKWDIKESLTSTYEYLEAFAKNKRGSISSGFVEIDNLLKGLKKPRTYIIGGLTGMGKTSFLIALARNFLLQEYKVLYFSLEMAINEILLRLLSGVARIPNTKIESPQEMGSDEWSRLTGAIAEVVKWPLIVCDGSYTTPQFEIEIKDHKPDIVIIDHIDCMPHYGDKENVPFFLADVVVQLKKIAKTYNCAVVFASQLKESAERKSIDTYDVNDYAGSRGKGRGVDVGMFICWPRQSDYLFQWKIAKNRFARVGQGKLHFAPAYGNFREFEE